MANKRLTPREFEIYMLIVTKAMGGKKIAAKLGISYLTQRTIQRNILMKMNMANTLELLIQYHRKELGNDTYD